ncbi:MAG TPA: glycosyltransferase family 2 protein [Steroidobacteraceae bacterium]
MPEISIVVPTFSEAQNVEELHARLVRSLDGEDWELIIVDDDSPDGTAEVVRRLAQHDRRVRCIQRIGRRGLSSAVVEGALSSSAPLIGVMDGDLQHDESVLPAMIDKVRAHGLDLAIGSRYTAGGSTGEWTGSRKWMSRFATRLARGLTPQDLSDPMSGFFVVRSSLVRETARRLSGYGYKILLDLIASAGRPLKHAEIPYVFRERSHGESKLDSLVMWEYLMLLADKRFGHIVPPRLVSFALVGGSGVAVHFAVLSGLYLGLAIKFPIAQAAAALAAMTSNFFLNNLLTYRDRRLRGLGVLRGLASFYVVCSLGALANIGIASYAFAQRAEWAVSALAGIVVGTLWNYLATARFTWRASRVEGA